jgi:hypothetical protein
MLKNSFARAVVLIAVALVLAIVTNGFASRTRRLMLPGYYPNALKVPPKEPVRVPPPPVTMTAPVTETTSSGCSVPSFRRTRMTWPRSEAAR